MTATGLKLLQNSSNAVSFFAGKPWHERTALPGHDGRLTELERRLSAHGHVDVVVTLNADALEFDVSKEGAVSYHPNGKAKASAAQRASSLPSQLTIAQAAGKDVAAHCFENAAANLGAPLDPEFTVRVNREGLEKLAASADVRSLKPTGFVDRRPIK